MCTPRLGVSWQIKRALLTLTGWSHPMCPLPFLCTQHWACAFQKSNSDLNLREKGCSSPYQKATRMSLEEAGGNPVTELAFTRSRPQVFCSSPGDESTRNYIICLESHHVRNEHLAPARCGGCSRCGHLLPCLKAYNPEKAHQPARTGFRKWCVVSTVTCISQSGDEVSRLGCRAHAP